jgi:hypothetical protein
MKLQINKQNPAIRSATLFIEEKELPELLSLTEGRPILIISNAITKAFFSKEINNRKITFLKNGKKSFEIRHWDIFLA